MAIIFTELTTPHQSPTEQWSVREGVSAQFSCWCAWADRYDVANYLLVTARQYIRSTSAVVLADSATIVPWPETPGTPAVFTPAAKYGKFANYAKAIITVSYSGTSPLGVNGNVYSEEFDASAEMLTLDPWLFTWSDGTLLKDAEAPGMVLRKGSYVVTFFRCTSWPTFAYSSLGCVNSDTVSGRGLPFEASPGTLVFESFHPIRKADAFNLTYRFTYQPWGWNYFWNANTGAFDYMKVATTGNAYNSYPQADLSATMPY
jgi:hypothetical protein